MAREREPKKPVEVDRVRFEGRKLGSGLFRHRAIRFIFELGRRRRKR
jgi:hypothetical protein